MRERDRRARQLVPFTAQTRMSGLDLDGTAVRKGATDSVRQWVLEHGGKVPDDLDALVDGIATAVARRWSGGRAATPVAADVDRVLGVIHLKDVVKQGMRERFDQLRAMGIRTVMITGDNPLTARAIAAEAGVDDFLAEATPEDKMALIRREQAGRPSRRHDRRRHQRRPGAGAGRRRRGHEHRHAGGQGSREHGRPRLRPDQAHRDRRDRQAAPHHPGLADHVLDRQRRGQVLRHHPGDVRRGVPPARHAERHGPRTRPARRSCRPSSSTPSSSSGSSPWPCGA